MGLMQFILVNVIETGSMFGELGIIYNRQRAATCLALTEIELGVMDKVNFGECFSEFQKMEERTKRNYVENNIIIEQELKFLAPKLGVMFKKKL